MQHQELTEKPGSNDEAFLLSCHGILQAFHQVFDQGTHLALIVDTAEVIVTRTQIFMPEPAHKPLTSLVQALVK